MQNKITISSKFNMTDWPQMDQFIATTHGENHVLRNRPLFDWFFLRNENKQEANIIVAYEGDKLISLLGYIPTTFLWGSEKIEGAWMAHWMTLEGYRFGVGALLMRKITELYPIVAGQGASLMNEEIVTKMKFSFLKQIPKVVYIFNYKKIDQFFNFSPTPKIQDLSNENLIIEDTLSITNENFTPDWNLYPSLKYGTLRDASYISNRYILYPFFKYHIFMLGEKNAPALCVIRIVDTNQGIKVARILEFFFPENDSGKALALTLVKQLLVFCNSIKCDFVDFYCTSNVQIDLLKRSGFIDENNGDLPSLLDPISLSRKYQNMELFVSRELKQKYPDSEKNFIVTRADGDQDRPNESYREN